MQLRAAWDEDTHTSLATILHLTYAFWQNLNMSQKSLKVMKLTFRMKDKCALAKKTKQKKDSVQLFAVMMTARWPALSSTATQQSGREFKTVGGKSKADWSVKNLSTDLQGVDDDAVVAAAGAEGSVYRKKNKHKRKLLLSLPHNCGKVSAEVHGSEIHSSHLETTKIFTITLFFTWSDFGSLNIYCCPFVMS